MIRIHREGRRIVAAAVLLLVALFVIAALYLPDGIMAGVTLLGFTLCILLLRFFRVPNRKPLQDDRIITAPADGKIVAIEKTTVDEFVTGTCIQVSIFMSVHDAHVNYYPVSGFIRFLKSHPGKYLVARHPKSSILNERVSIGIEAPHGPVLVRQIAGTVARRIRCYAVPDKKVRQGGEMGFIKFGSRLDLFLPEMVEITVELGQHVTGSITPIAFYK